MKNTTYKVASFFSGCGGLDLGLEGGFKVKRSSVINPNLIAKQADETGVITLKKTGLETIFACDIKTSAQKTWENFFQRPNTFELASIIDLVKQAQNGKYHFPEADIVTGGFPCQDFSIAGKRKGFSSHKNHNNQYIDPNKPTIENRGMLYYWLREAIAIINPKIFIAENVKGLATMEGVKETIAQDFSNINGGYYVLEPKVLNAANYGVPQNRERIFFIGIRNDLLTPTLKEKINQIAYPAPSHNVIHNTIVPSSEYLLDLPEPEQSKDLSHQKYSKAKWYGKHCQGQTEINLNGLAPTIRSEHHGNIEFRRLSIENGGKIVHEKDLPQRRLSVRECARLQTFPDNYPFVIKGVSASEAYKLIGNAVPPLFAYHIGNSLKQILDLLNIHLVNQDAA